MLRHARAGDAVAAASLPGVLATVFAGFVLADLLVVAAPTLLCTAVALLVVRALPGLMHRVLTLTARSRKVVPVLSAARAQAGSGAALPFSRWSWPRACSRSVPPSARPSGPGRSRARGTPWART